LSSYFAGQGLIFALIGNHETLEADLGVSFPVSPDQHLYHYYMGTSEYSDLIATRPDLKDPIDLINSIRLQLQVRISGEWVDMIHVVGAITAAAQTALEETEFGAPIDFGANTSVMGYGYSNPCLDASTEGVEDQSSFPIGNTFHTSCGGGGTPCFMPAGTTVHRIMTKEYPKILFCFSPCGGCCCDGVVCNCCDGPHPYFYVKKGGKRYQVKGGPSMGWYKASEGESGPFDSHFTGCCKAAVTWGSPAASSCIG